MTLLEQGTALNKMARMDQQIQDPNTLHNERIIQSYHGNYLQALCEPVEIINSGPSNRQDDTGSPRATIRNLRS